MPAHIGRDELAALTGQGAQLVEVLPAGDYDRAHLPGAVNLPLKELDAAPGEAAVGTVMRFGISTVRPSEDAAALAYRMGHRQVTRVVVTRSDGTLIGLFFAEDMPA